VRARLKRGKPGDSNEASGGCWRKVQFALNVKQKRTHGQPDQRASDLEGIGGKLKNLKLSEADNKSIKVGRKQACAPSTGNLQDMGKILSDRPAKAEYVKKTLGGIWSPFSEVVCKDMGRNRFLFSFFDEASMRKAMYNGPWDFNGSLIVMESFKPNKTIDDYEFKTIPIWVRAYDIPMGMMNMDTCRLVGEQIGEFVDIGLDEDGCAMGEYLRVKTRLIRLRRIDTFLCSMPYY
jgi:hypothetical protein